MDLCFNHEEGPGKEEREKARKEEVWRACRILEEARERSMPARKFLESLMDVLRRHRRSGEYGARNMTLTPTRAHKVSITGLR